MPARGRADIASRWSATPRCRLRLGSSKYEVRPEWIDYNGHMTDSRYLQVFGDATDALFTVRGRRRGVPQSRSRHVHGVKAT